MKIIEVKKDMSVTEGLEPSISNKKWTQGIDIYFFNIISQIKYSSSKYKTNN